MDSEFDSFVDFLAAPADADGAARKFRPKAKGRPKPRSSVGPSAAPDALKGNHVYSTPNVLKTTQENSAEVTTLSPPNCIGDSGTLNNADEPHLINLVHQGVSISTEPRILSQEVVSVGDGGSKDVIFEDLPVCGGDSCQTNAVEQCPNGAESESLLWNPFDDIDLGQSISAEGDGGKFRPKLKSCPVKQTLTSAKSGLSADLKKKHVEIYNDGSDSNRQENLCRTDAFGNNDMPKGSLLEGVPMDDARRVEMENYSSINVGLDDIQFDVTTDEGFRPHSRSSPGKSLNNNEKVFLGDMIVESYQYDSREVPCSTIMVDHGNPHPSFVDQGLDTCDYSQDQSMCGVTGNQHGMGNRDSTIDSGRMEPENCGVFDNDLLDGPSIFPPADDYFSINEHSIYGNDVCPSGASLADDDMHVETAHEIPVERVDDSALAEGNGTRQPSRVPRQCKAHSARPSEDAQGENDGLHDERDSAMSQDVSKDNNKRYADLKKKGVKRSRKSAPDNDQQTGSRKKVNDTSSEKNEKPKKKFSHSTRGRRKRVDPTFLATPDDEVDHTSVSFRDLIIRAEFLERDSKKLSTPSSAPATNQRTASPSPYEEPYYERNNFDSDQNEEYDDDNIEVQESSSYFNYHSFMTKTPRVAWSKLDTELFYQGIRQFGTDFTLIQQLFPGRTRNQIKLKYKKEERQHPQRISEAIENRANGISYFQQVIEKLKATDTQEDQELSDDLNGTEANEDNVQEAELNDNASTRLEQNDVVAKDDAEAIDTTTEVQPESEKMDEDDDFGWDNYVSL